MIDSHASHGEKTTSIQNKKKSTHWDEKVYVGYLPEESLTWTLSYTLWAS
jgi:hypothetical protein